LWSVASTGKVALKRGILKDFERNRDPVPKSEKKIQIFGANRVRGDL